jgi:hypothetical protein
MRRFWICQCLGRCYGQCRATNFAQTYHDLPCRFRGANGPRWTDLRWGTATEQQLGHVALAFLVRGEEWAFLVAERLATILARVKALWYPGEEPRWGPDED